MTEIEQKKVTYFLMSSSSIWTALNIFCFFIFYAKIYLSIISVELLEWKIENSHEDKIYNTLYICLHMIQKKSYNINSYEYKKKSDKTYLYNSSFSIILMVFFNAFVYILFFLTFAFNFVLINLFIFFFFYSFQCLQT